ncbi:MAG TPA: glycosyltransferase family 2 protein [Roseiflexaceae bacterium]|nr:glycosyltransferase family 2 protein [Roseiflexaceae bacterium]
MWEGKRVSVILPTYNEKASIRQCIEAFFATSYVDEVVVVNNNAAPGTAEEVAQTRARQVFEPRQGYGYSIQRGLAEATGDLLVICEPDGTFRPRDIVRFLAYSDEFSVVLGTRTTRELIGERANMGLFLRWGNWAVAKMMMILFNTTSLSDVGCTFRLLHREAYEAIRPYFSIGSSHFGVEMMLLIFMSHIRTIEISVNYLERVGVSSVTGDLRKAFVLGMTMIAFTLRSYVVHRLLRRDIPRYERQLASTEVAGESPQAGLR